MRLARLAYGALFVVFLPAGLLLWARAMSPLVRLPAIHVPEAGAALATLGVLLIAAGIRDLIVLGGGLPMNAFPPPHFVRTGIYRWVRDPIYIGFVLACAGVSIASGSPAGLWIVTPVTALACAALVYGYERHDLRRRFGRDALQPPVLSIPPDDDHAASATHRAAVFLWVLIPWVVIFYAVQALGRPADAFGTALPFESGWTVLQWTELGYVSTYLFIPVTALLIRTQRDLRRFAVQALIAIVVVSIAWLTIPVVATNRPFVPTSALGRLLALEQAHSNGVAAFPAFHVLWALIAAEAWHGNVRSSGRNWWGWIGWLWAAIITVTSVTTSMHTVVEVGAAIALFLPIRQYERTWASVRAATELIANSWKEWRVGPVRIISHGVWAAAGAGVGSLVAGSAAGPDRLGAVIWIALCGLVGAGLWAQALEGSSKLLRPFGWYGGILGGVVGALTAAAVGWPTAPLLAAFAIAAPWIQILGRVRCLVQGCCHGGPASPRVGIRYQHRRSRVTQLADLAGVPIHATPLYSIAGNIVIGVALLRLRVVGTPDSLIIGIYLILAAVARFVEESFRAEPQTPILAGLHSYQWMAVGSLLAGIVCTTIPTAASTPTFVWPDARLVWSAIAMAMLAGFALGVDF
ncbi:MAG TPA: prolipoprotein diacylglyceryl transferase family protein, partial [Vicinamibacterales bacterium]|nr:prolipoprotein diacylglyceryl transferase family protein [Vicinamibacterales bacterium]